MPRKTGTRLLSYVFQYAPLTCAKAVRKPPWAEAGLGTAQLGLTNLAEAFLECREAGDRVKGLADYAILYLDGHRVYITHGHNFGENNPPKLQDGDILMHGHTHIPACRDKGTFLYLNPGSVSIPKDGSVHGYMTWEDGTFTWKDLDGCVVSEQRI